MPCLANGRGNISALHRRCQKSPRFDPRRTAQGGSIGIRPAEWWAEPAYGERKAALRGLTSADMAEIVDCRGLRDTEVSWAKHLGTHFVNMQCTT